LDYSNINEDYIPVINEEKPLTEKNKNKIQQKSMIVERSN